MNTQTADRKEPQSDRFNLEVVDCARPPVCKVHGNEVTTVVCDKCLNELLGVSE